MGHHYRAKKQRQDDDMSVMTERERARGARKIVAFDPLVGRIAERPFVAPLLLRNAHAMTMIGTQRPRRFSILGRPTERREFQTEPETRVMAHCHWQEDRHSHPTALIVHGLEGSSEGAYVLGTASKAFDAGFNVLRYNVRGCGGTAHLTPKLYHSGLTTDLHAVARELIEQDGLPELFLIGFSMGGNQSLKFAGELGEDAPPQLKGICAISPPIDLESCSHSIRQPENWIYEIRFLISLRKTMRERDRLFPGIYDLRRMDQIRHLWDWDEEFQHYNGFDGARDYYAKASSIAYLSRIRTPSLIIHAKDDPFIPFAPFNDPRLTTNESILLAETRHGGHVAFCGRGWPDEDRAWAENRAVEFCRSLAGRMA